MDMGMEIIFVSKVFTWKLLLSLDWLVQTSSVQTFSPMIFFFTIVGVVH